jgi:hypothetical protein
VRGDEPIFIEFNINNGFYCADHSVDELYQMVNFYRRQFFKRLGPQLLNFDPFAACVEDECVATDVQLSNLSGVKQVVPRKVSEVADVDDMQNKENVAADVQKKSLLVSEGSSSPENGAVGLKKIQ